MSRRPRANAWVINTNLAQPIRKAPDPERYRRAVGQFGQPVGLFKPEALSSDEVEHPHLRDDLLVKNKHASILGFKIPPEIRLRVYLYDDPRLLEGLSDSEREIAERLQKLGHGVTGIIHRDEPDTRVDMEVVWGQNHMPTGANYSVYWDAAGSFHCPRLDQNPLRLKSQNLRGHAELAGGVALLDFNESN